MKFRLLRADEIECRISTCNQYGVSLLLYKDARCDMNILDETVKPENWQRHHLRDNANCVVAIWDKEKGQWIEKEDTGTESYTEAEKGLASDSFKRACFNWGIGRELYTAPHMFVQKRDLETLTETNGKWTCRDYFTVAGIEYDGNRIVWVKVENPKTGESVEFGTPSNVEQEQNKVKAQTIDDIKVKALIERCKSDGVQVQKILTLYKVERLEDLTEVKHANIHEHWEQIKRA